MAIYLVTFCVEQDSGIIISYCLLGVCFHISHSPFHSCPQIKFENRKRGDIGNDCLLLVDGTDFWIAMGYSKIFWSYKFKKSGLCYKVALCIRTGDICWWIGPYAPGVWNDNMIFNDALVLALEPGEQCETDRGYEALPQPMRSVWVLLRQNRQPQKHNNG